MASQGIVVIQRLHRLTPNTEFFHQPLKPTACYGHRFSLELPPHLARAVIAIALLLDTLDLRRELLVALYSCTAPLWILRTYFIMMMRRWCNRQFFADWLDTANIMILIDKVNHRFGLRSRSARAKSGGLAQFVIRGFELAYLPLQFFRPLRLIGRDTGLHTRIDVYLLLSSPFLLLSSPILDATDCIAAQRDEWSCSPVKTNRTARSRTSFAYLGRLFIS